MLEVPDAAHDHGHAVLVGGGDDLFVPDRSAGVQRPPSRRPRRPRRARPGTGRRRPRRRRCPRVSSPTSRARMTAMRAESTRFICPAPTPTTWSARGQHDGVGLGVLGDAPGESERRHLGRGGRALRHDPQRGRVEIDEIGVLEQQSADHAPRLVALAPDSPAARTAAGRRGTSSSFAGAPRARPARMPARRGSRAGCRTAP